MKIKFYLRVTLQALVFVSFLPLMMGADLVGGGCSSDTPSASSWSVTFSGAQISFEETSPQSVVSGETLTLHLTPDSGYTLLTNVEGDCPAGSWNETTYTTGVITQDCDMLFSAAPIESTATVTPEVGAEGSISPSTAQVVNSGDSITFTATPNAGYGVDEWSVDGVVAQSGGTTFELTNITANHTVSVSFSSLTTTLTASVASLGLSVNNTGLNAALTGTPRLISIANAGASPAENVTYSPSPALPSGTTMSPASCGTIAVSGTCVLTITPGSTPSAAPGDTNPTPITLSISGSNTNTLTPTINILTYGSVYRGGYVYAVDDTTLDIGSIGGKVAALTDQSAGVIWSSNGSGSVVHDNIPGITEISTSPPGACNGATDGACNTSEITAYYSPPTTNPAVDLSFYAAGLCRAPIEGFSDWYFPAICEMGYDEIGSGANGCGTQASPTIQNMLSNLFDAAVGGLSGEYWSSTEWAGDATLYAWSQTYDLGNIPQFTFDKSYNTIRVRCSRTLIP